VAEKCVNAVERVFGSEVDYAQVGKVYAASSDGEQVVGAVQRGSCRSAVRLDSSHPAVSHLVGFGFSVFHRDACAFRVCQSAMIALQPCFVT
jgi:hypothetical protein